MARGGTRTRHDEIRECTGRGRDEVRGGMATRNERALAFLNQSIIVAAAAAAVAVAAQPRQGGRTRLVPTAVGKSVSRTGGAPGARAAECRTRAWTRPGFPEPSFF